MRDSLAAMAGALANGEVVETARIDEAGAVVVLEICGLPGPVTGLEGFAFARVEAAPGQVELRLGLAVLMALALGMTALLTLLVGGFARRVAGIERALAGPALPVLAPTGERELDRIVAALNGAGARLEAARLDGVRMAARVAQAERLAALGRVAAGVAHEIRNPIAAMRLRAENGLAGDDARRVAALQAVLAQIGRLDRLLGELLEMTQRRDARPVTTAFPGFLEGVAADYRGLGAEIVVTGEDFTAAVDPDLLRRALDGVLQNAVRHAETRVTLRGDLGDEVVRVTVADDGAGVAAAVRGTLFEPFVTGTPGGTGLGLSITREMVAAQGGRVWLAEGSGAVFVVEIPCR